MKVVLDTNVIASGIFWSGPPCSIIQSFFQGSLDIFVTEEIFDEYERVLTLLGHKYKQSINEILEAIKIKSHWSTPATLDAQVCEDADDDKFIACAIASRVKTLVSGDRLLLRCSGYHSIDIVTPRLFVETHL